MSADKKNLAKSDQLQMTSFEKIKCKLVAIEHGQVNLALTQLGQADLQPKPGGLASFLKIRIICSEKGDRAGIASRLLNLE